jgi:hypothetical protein
VLLLITSLNAMLGANILAFFAAREWSHMTLKSALMTSVAAVGDHVAVVGLFKEKVPICSHADTALKTQ